MARYRKKPIVVEAEQFWADKKPWPAGVVECDPGVGSGYAIMTTAGLVGVRHGEWIITGPAGEQYHPCPDERFKVAYEPVS
jgi:hypothetical protein